MSADNKTDAAPLSEVMLAMDVVDTLRYRQDLAVREIKGGERKSRMIERLRAVYKEQGIDVPDRILLEGVDALEEGRFSYEPAPASFSRTLAQLYVSRSKWAKWVIGGGLAAVLSISAYFFAYIPFQQNQLETARIELAEEMPAQMQEIFQTIFNETKVQTAVTSARALLKRGQTAAREGDRLEAQSALADLAEIRDQLRANYSLRVVNRDGVQSGFWTFPEINRDATNYYIVVEAVDGDGNILKLPIANEETGQIETVALWGLRVPEFVYNSIGADKRDDGIIQRNIIGQKEAGFLNINYAIPVSGGAVTRW
ncbi:hypothetical protein MNBD_ALPHA11-1081 [hydrothermal vent metagenome]|uniref:Uncharacterized protein n=1 Tax=hydrothermal vent metagenome TaxID=652676 RepID=A0A3B0UHC2_9ZZZZ